MSEPADGERANIMKMMRLISDRWKSALAESGLLDRKGAASNGNGRAGSAAHDDGEPPLRAELFSIGQLERHAKSLAGWHRIAPARRWSGNTAGR